MKNGGIFRKFAEFVGKDTNSQNESKKMIVVLRILLLLIAFYCVLNSVICVATHDFSKLLIFIFFLAVNIGEFILSYYFHTMTAFYVFNVGILGWILIMVHLFGWNIGVQHFLIVLLILFFFSRYKQYAGKIFFAVALCLIRIFLFYNYQNRVPNWQLSVLQEDFFQIINTLMIFGCISVIGFVFSNDVQELEGKLVEYNNQLKKQANTDTLTGLYNRRKALEVMERICSNQLNHMGFCLSICDIDFFKKVNDNYGHDVGDEVLKKVADILTESMRETGIAARWGGEEFLLIFPECNGDIAYTKLEDIRNKIKNMRVQEETFEFGITMTFGLAEYDFQNGLNATLKEADKKLYMGKEKGRDIIIY